MKDPIIHVPALADQKRLLEALYGVGCTYYDEKPPQAWNLWCANYVGRRAEVVYPYIYLLGMSRIRCAALSPEKRQKIH